jgi:hypothetical protein
MALVLSHHAAWRIMLAGRWKSHQAFLIYICKQIQQFSKGVSEHMISNPDFYHVPDIDILDSPESTARCPTCHPSRCRYFRWHHITLHRIASHCITSHCIASYCITSHTDMLNISFHGIQLTSYYHSRPLPPPPILLPILNDGPVRPPSCHPATRALHPNKDHRS